MLIRHLMIKTNKLSAGRRWPSYGTCECCLWPGWGWFVFFFIFPPKELEYLVENCMVKWKGMLSIPSGICKTWEEHVYWISHSQIAECASNNVVSSFNCTLLDNLVCLQNCLALQSNHPQALTNLGNIYMEWYVLVTNQWILVVTSCILQLLLCSFGWEAVLCAVSDCQIQWLLAPCFVGLKYSIVLSIAWAGAHADAQNYYHWVGRNDFLKADF